MSRFTKALPLLISIAAALLSYNFFSNTVLTRWNFRFPLRDRPAANAYPDIGSLRNGEWTFKEYAKYFADLAQKKGGEYAYNVLKQAHIAPNIDMHLLGHIVSDEIYKQEGAEGIRICDNDFRNACSHAIVVGILLEKGEAGLGEIAQACRLAPGGRGAYTMCFHGLGHGVLAYKGFDLKETIPLCEKTGTFAYGNREYIECVGGAIMEMIGGGFHNKNLWEKQRKKFILENDPLSPCNQEFMPKAARPICYNYLTPSFFVAAGANLNAPGGENFKNAFPFCNKIPLVEKESREECYGGFGKEFVVLAKNRDVRNIERMTQEELSRVYDWCLLADNRGGQEACLRSAVNSLFWGGENDPDVSIRFCGLMQDGDFQSLCFTHLISNVGFYIGSPDYREKFCKQLPQAFWDQCEATLSSRNKK